LLDNGSPICFIGDKVIELLKVKNYKIKSESRRIGGFFASSILSKFVDIDIDLDGNIHSQKCVLAPGHLEYVILGRDFFKIWDIVPYTLDGGFKMRKISKELIPYTIFEGNFTKSNEPDVAKSLILETSWLNEISLITEEKIDLPLSSTAKPQVPMENSCSVADQYLNGLAQRINFRSFENPQKEISFAESVHIVVKEPQIDDDMHVVTISFESRAMLLVQLRFVYKDVFFTVNSDKCIYVIARVLQIPFDRG